MSKMIIANWKSNPDTFEKAEEIFRPVADKTQKLSNVNVIICPPDIYLERISTAIQDIPLRVNLGAQNSSWEESGPHTGELGISMIKNLGVKYVLVGHSERRAIGETDEMINKKIKALLKNDIIPVFLVGEHEKNDAIRSDIIVDQITRGLKDIESKDADRIVYAYEPSWAISGQSGNHADNIEGILSGVTLIKKIILKLYNSATSQLVILYGGSVNSDNAQEIISQEEIGGAVVGGASLKPEEFNKILEIVNENN